MKTTHQKLLLFSPAMLLVATLHSGFGQDLQRVYGQPPPQVLQESIRATSELPGGMGGWASMIMILILALFLGLLAVQACVFIRCRGVLRMVALLPLLALAFVLVRILVDTQADPTSHNLWPFEVGMWSFLSLVFLSVLFGVRAIIRLTRRPRSVLPN